jgi:hypothetical protein
MEKGGSLKAAGFGDGQVTETTWVKQILPMLRGLIGINEIFGPDFLKGLELFLPFALQNINR